MRELEVLAREEVASSNPGGGRFVISGSQMKLHVEVTLLAPETTVVKKKKRTLRAAAWVVYEGKELRGAGRIGDDAKGLIATSAGRMFAASLHLAHGKLIEANTIEATVNDGTAPKPKAANKPKQAEANGEAKPAKAKAPKAKQGAKPAEETTEAPVADAAAAESPADKPAKKAKKAVANGDTPAAEALAKKPAKKAKKAAASEEVAAD